MIISMIMKGESNEVLGTRSGVCDSGLCVKITA